MAFSMTTLMPPTRQSNLASSFLLIFNLRSVLIWCIVTSLLVLGTSAISLVAFHPGGLRRSSIAIGLAACVAGFGIGFLVRPKLDPRYIQLLNDPGGFGEYFKLPGDQGWLILDLDVVNDRRNSFMPSLYNETTPPRLPRSP